MAGNDPRTGPVYYVSTTRVAITLGTGEGRLSAMIKASPKTIGGDLCSAQAAAVLSLIAGAPDTNCQVLTINGVQVRVTSGPQPQRGQVVAAVRPLRGGFLAVIADQAVRAYGAETDLPPDAPGNGAAPSAKPGLPTVPFAGDQLAALAADPRMLP